MKQTNKFYWLIGLLALSMALAGCGGGETTDKSATTASTGDVVAGEGLFNQVCITCHGAGGIGIAGLGKDMTASQFIHDQTDQELLTFVKTGRPVGDPLNTTGVDMPPKGGNPALTDEQILDIIAYIRTVQK